MEAGRAWKGLDGLAEVGDAVGGGVEEGGCWDWGVGCVGKLCGWVGWCGGMKGGDKREQGKRGDGGREESGEEEEVRRLGNDGRCLDGMKDEVRVWD